MTSLGRLNQIKEIQSNFDDRASLEASIIDLNIKTTKENKEIINIIEKYIENFIKSDDFSLDYILDLLKKLKAYKGYQFQTDISLNKMLFTLIYSLVLLPNYLKTEKEVENYNELKKIIDGYLINFNKEINLLQENRFHLEIGNTFRLRKEIDENIELGEEYPIDTRVFEIGEGFGNNIFCINEENGLFCFKIPINIDLKNKKLKRKINDKILLNILSKLKEKALTQINTNGLNISLVKEVDSSQVYGEDNNNYLTLNISKKKNVENFQDIVSYLNDLIKINNFFINELAIEFGLEIDKKINFFSSGETINITINKKDKINSDNQYSENEEKNIDFKQFQIPQNKKLSLSDIGGLSEAKKEIETIIKLIKNKDTVNNWGAKTTKGIIFEGPTGTGKTLLAKVIAGEIDADIYNIKLTDILSGAYLNEGANNIKNLFTFLRSKSKKDDKKIIVILDELDALFGKRGSGDLHQEDKKIVNTFLSEMSGMEDLENIIFIGTTNLIESIDSAIIRSGRMETKIHVGLPNLKDKIEIYKIHINKLPPKAKEAFNKVNLEEVAKLGENISGADIESIINKIVTKKAMEEIDTNSISDISIEDFKVIINGLKSSDKKKTIGFL
ncbi:ATP-binding protein [Candidatus Gracilibacteria bacterium]|nr:ATP-binding protein [Candidatus Gracilibacteria bacterium]